ncbi:hypothetical protein PVAP13_5KG699501 [Panicum virgatum]|uniref:Uncharacterized protein n=1 Tax=Panicum virgatum TaxID=38727 RepID=A0A8T0SUX2_PANVG|nr:hypothetical protein PVAP13_5KG699501 [Panicum virgatum]
MLLYFVLEIEKGPIHPPSWSIDPYSGTSTCPCATQAPAAATGPAAAAWAAGGRCGHRAPPPRTSRGRRAPLPPRAGAGDEPLHDGAEPGMVHGRSVASSPSRLPWRGWPGRAAAPGRPRRGTAQRELHGWRGPQHARAPRPAQAAASVHGSSASGGPPPPARAAVAARVLSLAQASAPRLRANSASVGLPPARAPLRAGLPTRASRRRRAREPGRTGTGGASGATSSRRPRRRLRVRGHHQGHPCVKLLTQLSIA